MLFSQIVGQERAKRFLRQAMAREKIPHAYLFTGISGVGKTSTAMALSTALNCTEPVDYDGCGQCLPCRLMISGNFPDFLSIRPEGQNIRIHQIRDLNRGFGFPPASGRYRICVIHQAETMTVEAANSFLKALEEPPPGNILILKANEPMDLLPTIVSRCQRVPFQPLKVSDIMNWLVEKKGLSNETAKALALISGGSLGLALQMCGVDFLDRRQEWLLRVIRLAGLSRDNALDVAFECAGEDHKKALDIAESGGPGLRDMLMVWEGWYRDLLLLKAGGREELLINQDFSRKLKKIAEDYTIDNLVDSVLAIEQSQRDLRRMRNPQLVMEHMVMGINSLGRSG
ncbi:MAG: DNA polymerase III subunit delta' [Pseudomonadota bacterium]